MKVAQVCPRFSPYIGGIETHVSKVSELLAKKKGVQVEVLTCYTTNKVPSEENINGVLIRRFKSWAPREAYYFSGELKSYMRKHFSDYDVIHAHSYHDLPALYCAQAKDSSREISNKGLFVFTPHYHGRGSSAFTSFLHTFYRPLFGKKIFKQSDLVVSVSKYERMLIESHFRDSVGKVVTIPNGVDVPSQASSPDDMRSVPSNYVLYVGRLEPYKRVEKLVSSLKYLSRADVSLVLVGSGPSKGKITSLAQKLAIENRVSFFENLRDDELDALYRRASIVANLSKFEAYGLTIAEGLARGVPAVVAKSTALSEWVDEVNCLGVDNPEDPKMVAKALDRMIGKRVTNLRINSWSDVADDLMKTYESHGAG